MSIDAQVAALQRRVEEQGEQLRCLVDSINLLRNPQPEVPAPVVEGGDAEVAKVKARRKAGE